MATMRDSPPTKRIVRIINLLASEPQLHRNLTEVARTLDISTSTCLGILQELTQAGYVVRHPDRTYSLGASLISIGAAARDGRPGIARAREEIRSLSERYDRVVTASAVVGDQIVVLDAAGQRHDSVAMVRTGAPFPFMAPIGLMFTAWAPDDAVEAWLARSPFEIEQEKIDRLWSVVRAARIQGYIVDRLTHVEMTLHQFLASNAHRPLDELTRQALPTALAIFADRDYLTDELESSKTASVSFICAPCFDAHGSVEVMIGIYVMRNEVPIEEIHDMTEQLLKSCQAVTDSIGGRSVWEVAS